MSITVRTPGKTGRKVTILDPGNFYKKFICAIY